MKFIILFWVLGFFRSFICFLGFFLMFCFINCGYRVGFKKWFRSFGVVDRVWFVSWGVYIYLYAVFFNGR